MPDRYSQDATSRIAARPSLRLFALELVVVDGPSRGAAASVSTGTARVGSSAFRVDVGHDPAFVELSARDSFGELIGASLEMRRLYAVLERVAATDATVLVEGETGTGKDVLARSLHAA